MKITPKQIEKMVKMLLADLKESQVVEFKDKEDAILRRAIALVNQDFEKEKMLDEEVHTMMDDLERQNPGGFERYKMFPLLKKRLAKEKGIVL